MNQLIPKKIPDFQTELDRDPRLKSIHTVRNYKQSLTAFEEWRNGRPFTKLLVEEYATFLQDAGKAPSTINRTLSAIRWWARRLGDLVHEVEGASLSSQQRQQITLQTTRVSTVRSVRGRRLPKGRHIPTKELASLLRVCANDQRPAGRRDAAMIALGWSTGLRRGELVSLTIADIKMKNDEEISLLIHGKGDQERIAYLYGGALKAMNAWLRIRGETVPGPLFCPILKNDRLRIGYSISTEAAAKILFKRAIEAGIKELINWHDFRRTFAGNLLDNGADLITVQQLMGHISPTTTSLYDRRDDHAKRKAVKTIEIPFLY